MQQQRDATSRSVLYALAFFSGFALLAFWLIAPDHKGSSIMEIGANKLHVQRTDQDSDPAIVEKPLLALGNSQRLAQESEAVEKTLPDYVNPDGSVDLTSAEGSAEVAEAEGQEPMLEERLAALEDAQNEERLEAVNQLWYYAADHGVPEEALEALYDLAMDPDQEIAEQALAALEDLWNLQDQSEATAQVLPEYDDPDDPEGVNLVGEGLEIGNPEASEQWTTSVLDAVHETDEERRGDAVGAVTLRRHDGAVTALTDVTAFDPSPEIRYQALEALWYAAADGLDADGQIRATLEEAVSDPDPDVSALAKRALEDLRGLE